MGCIKDNDNKKNAKKKGSVPIGEDEVGRLNKMTDLKQKEINTITDKSPI